MRFAHAVRDDRRAIWMMMAGQKTVSLALQGGGAHGAFTWGVIDGLLADGRIRFDAISGTSAGAMNAVVMADGLARGGVIGAQQRLEEFWHSVSREGGLVSRMRSLLDPILSFWSLPGMDWDPADIRNFTSPYAFNPLNINPLKEVVEGLIDFDKVRAYRDLHLFLAATNVRSGKIKVFTGDEITADALLASACLPYIFRAVEIDGEAYWDGGFLGNPPLFPLFDMPGSEDILLVQVNPIERDEVPHTAHAIVERMSEITFNASLLREFRAIDFVNRLMRENKLDPKRYRTNRLHRIDAGKALAQYTAATKLDTSWSFFQELHRAGQLAAAEWLKENYDAIGVKGTLELRKAFL
jgi:NTE family protein